MRVSLVIVIAALLSVASGCDLGRETQTDEPPASDAADEPRMVVVDWLGRGDLYAARVIGEREGLTGVEYADGDREWVDSSRIRGWPELVGRRVQVWIRHRPTDVMLTERRGSLFHARFDDGSDTWVSIEMLYALEGNPPSRVDGPRVANIDPLRPAVDPARVREGADILAYWVRDGAVQGERAWLCRIVAIDGETVRVRFYTDGSEATIGRQHVLRVFESGARPVVGQRVWLAGPQPVGEILEIRGDLVKVRQGEQDERWLERDALFGEVEPIAPTALPVGTFVTVLYGAELYHARVRSLDGAQVLVEWFEGSDPSAVAAANVVETWTPTRENP